MQQNNQNNQMVPNPLLYTFRDRKRLRPILHNYPSRARKPRSNLNPPNLEHGSFANPHIC